MTQGLLAVKNTKRFTVFDGGATSSAPNRDTPAGVDESGKVSTASKDKVKTDAPGVVRCQTGGDAPGMYAPTERLYMMDTYLMCSGENLYGVGWSG